MAIDQIESLPFVKEPNPVYGKMNLRRADALEKVKKLYAARKESDIDLFEGFLDKVAPQTRKKAAK